MNLSILEGQSNKKTSNALNIMEQTYQSYREATGRVLEILKPTQPKRKKCNKRIKN